MQFLWPFAADYPIVHVAPDYSVTVVAPASRPQLGVDGETEVQQTFDPRNPYAQGWGWWYFSQAQVYDDHIAWTARYLPAGSYELTYTLVLLQPGEYRAIPARSYPLYFPEVQANSAGDVFKITP